jgi:NAD(P)-dependent dehydrogenase (short-subunit alcohol dehydrogenase family)
MTGTSAIFTLEGKNAVVTGSSAGLGARLARTLVLAGARVAGIARRRTELDEEARSTGRVLSVQADLAEPVQVQHAAIACLELLGGRVDILVNNAAWQAAGVRAEDESYAEIRRTLAINVEAAMLLAQAFFPGMRAGGGGSIINVTSITASVGIGRFPQAAYAVTKGGLEALTREWAAQWGRHGIRVNSLAPGVLETEFTSSVIHLPEVQDWVLGNALIPRHGQPEDFDGALLLLASDAGRYITGQRLTVDGGWTAHLPGSVTPGTTKGKGMTAKRESNQRSAEADRRAPPARVPVAVALSCWPP